MIKSGRVKERWNQYRYLKMPESPSIYTPAEFRLHHVTMMSGVVSLSDIT